MNVHISETRKDAINKKLDEDHTDQNMYLPDNVLSI
jgi:hypothetical protein